MTRPTTEAWRTKITNIADGVISYRGTPVQSLIENGTFEGVIALLLLGASQPPEIEDALRRALIAAADHGLAAPSIATSRIVASTRVPIAVAVGTGLIAFGGPAHGGAAQEVAKLLIEVQAEVAAGLDESSAIAAVIGRELAAGHRVPGFGHPVHSEDPRVGPLLGAPLSDRTYRDLARSIEAQMLQHKKVLRMNADTAVAALLLDAGLEADQISAVTALGRCVGLAAHVIEEFEDEEAFRAPSPSAITYTGQE
jgi:citrate synthase